MQHPLLPAVLVALILLIAPWPEGAVMPVWAGPLEWVAALLLLLFALQPARVLGPLSRPLRWLALGVVSLLGLGALQLVPIGGLLPLLSPPTAAHIDPFVPAGLAGPGTISLYPWQTRVVTCMWAAAAAILLATARACREPRAPTLVAGALVVAASAVAAVGLGYHVMGGSLPWVEDWASARMVGSYRNPNHLAGLLVLALPLCLAFAGIGDPQATGTRRRLLWLAPGGLLLACVVLTRSRGGTLAALIALGVYVALTTPGRLREVPRRALGGAIAAALFLLTLGLDPLAERFSQATDELGQDVSRLAFTREALRIGAEFPIFGAGLRSQEQLTPARVPASKLVNATHNDYANLFADGGLWGVACLALILGGFFLIARRGHARTQGRRRLLWAACIAGIAGHLLWAGAEFNLQIQANLWAFSAVAGLALTLAGPRRPRPASPPPRWLERTAQTGLALGALALIASSARLAYSDWVLLQDRAQVAAATDDAGAVPAAVVSRSLTRLRAAQAWDPENATVALRRGLLRLEARDFSGAVEPLRSACALEPRDAFPHLQLARALLATGQAEAAQPHLAHAAALAPHFASRRLLAAQLWLWSYRTGGDRAALEAGLADLQATLRWNPQQVGAALRIVAELAPDVSAATLARMLPPEHPQLRRDLAADLLRRERKLDAIRLLAPLAKREDAAPEDLLVWAQAQLAIGGVETAAGIYQQVLPDLAPDRRRSGLRQALGSLRQAGRPAAAVEVAEAVVAAAPDDPELQHSLGEARLAAGQPADACDAFERAVELGRAASGVPLGRALLQLGRARSAIEAWERAWPALASQQAPYVGLTLELARLLEAEGRGEDALALLRRARRRYPTDDRLRDASPD